MDLSKGFLDSVLSEPREHTIIDFLSRPVVVAQGNWTTASQRGTQLLSLAFPSILVNNPMYQEKLRGFVGLRATLCVRVQVNSQPFQQGRLLLQYYPYASYMANRATMVNYSLQGRTGCPRTDLDLSVATECDLCIPYVSPHLFYNLVTGQGSFGDIYLVVYSPLIDLSTSVGVEYTVWAHLEDIHLQYPTGAPIYTGTTPNRFHLIDKLYNARDTAHANEIIAKMSTLNEPDTIYAQTELEFLNKHDAPSAGLGQIASGLNTLSYIPVLGNIFTRPAWITAKLSNLLKFFGFSKPTVYGSLMEMRNRTAPRMTNFDGSDLSHKMALSSDNSLETVPGLAGTSVDEMALTTITSIPNYWDNFVWDHLDASGTVLWQTNVTPYLIKPYSSTITNRFLCTHMGYVAQLFGFWRGSIVYTFKFVKTKFHSGRVLISFIPFWYTNSTGVLDINKCYKMVVDLRTATEVSFTVPYVSTRPWMFCASSDDTFITDNLWNTCTGSIRVQVLNELRAVETVSQRLDVLVEIAGGPDLTFASPSLPKYVPSNFDISATKEEKQKKEKEPEKEDKNKIEKINVANKNTPPTEVTDIQQCDYTHLMGDDSVGTTCLGTIHYKDKEGLETIKYTTLTIVEPQGVGVDEAIPRNDAQTGRFPSNIDQNKIVSNWSPEAFCIGEKIFSVRQLIKRFNFQGSLNLRDNSTGAIIIAPHLPARPALSLTSSRFWGYYDYFYYIFAFYRGGMRFKHAVGSTNEGTNRYVQNQFVGTIVKMYNSFSPMFETLITRFAASLDYALATNRTGLNTSCTSEIIVYRSQEGMIEFEIPYYNVSHLTQCSFSATAPRFSSQAVLRGAEPPVLLTVYPTTSVEDTAATPPGPYNYHERHTLYRAASDDFSFMYLVGVPILVLQ